MITAQRIRELAQQAGFDDAGCAPAERLDNEAERLQQWLAQGCHGSMRYMEENFEKRVNPEAMVPGTKTVVVTVLSYFKHNPQPQGAPYIALSGLSERDYHEVVKEKLGQLEQLIIAEQGEDAVNNDYQHLFCDSAPVLERAWAKRCGLGFIGKNRQFIHPTLGSYVHLGVLYLATEVSAETPKNEPFCPADCKRCLCACPTKAICDEGMDARRCVSYLTIERKEELPEEHVGKPYIGLYGCDNCQKVCPFNEGLVPDRHPELQANPVYAQLDRSDWENMSRKQKTKLLKRIAK